MRSHSTIPVLRAQLLGRQAVHDVRPVVGLYVPTEHDVHELAPSVEYLPAAQVPVSADRPVVAQ